MNNKFENDYIISILLFFIEELKTTKSQAQVIDKYAVELTAFMNGQIAQAVKPYTGEIK